MPTRTKKRPANASTLPGDGEQDVELYDFRRPTTLAREHSRVLELAFETFARQWGTQLTSKIRAVAQVTSEQVLIQTYDDYAAALPSTTAMVLCRISDIDAKGVIQFPASAALRWVAHMAGGNGSRTPADRKFTQIEQALIRNLMEDALEDLRYSLGPLLTAAISVDSMQYNAQFAQAAATNDLMLVTHFNIRVGDNVSAATVALPADTLLPQLGASNKTQTLEEAKGLVAEQLSQVPVDVSMSLNSTTVLPIQILNLAVGDLISLPHPKDRPYNITVSGQLLAQAAPGKNGSRLAGRIVTTEENNR